MNNHIAENTLLFIRCKISDSISGKMVLSRQRIGLYRLLIFPNEEKNIVQASLVKSFFIIFASVKAEIQNL